jgi:hypothetical protein
MRLRLAARASANLKNIGAIEILLNVIACAGDDEEHSKQMLA